MQSVYLPWCFLLSPTSIAANQTILSYIDAVKMVLQFLTQPPFLGHKHNLCLLVAVLVWYFM